MNNILIHNACYRDQVIEDYKGHPFIEALPPILSEDEVTVHLEYYPTKYKNDRILADHYRVHSLISLSQIFIISDRHYELENKISLMIRQGYKSRNPANGKYIKKILNAYERVQKGDLDSIVVHNTISTAFSTSLIGCSGIGKTTTLCRILGLYPQAIKHIEYNIVQVVWLKLECPKNASLVGLCHEFFSALDRILGSNYVKKYCRKRRTSNQLLLDMQLVAGLHAIGILVIDEIQNLDAKSSGGYEVVLNFFVGLENKLGIPILTVGTLKAQKLFQIDFRQARRVEQFGSMIWLQYNNKSDDWSYLVEQLWKYQVLRKKTKLSNEIKKCLFECSQGITSVLISLFLLSQKRAIDIKDEYISVDLIREVFDDCFKFTRPMLDALKNNDRAALEKYDDIRPPCLIDQVSINTIKERKKVVKKEVDISEIQQIEMISKLLSVDSYTVKLAWNNVKYSYDNDDKINLPNLVIDELNGRYKTDAKKDLNKTELSKDDLRCITKKSNQCTNYEALKQTGNIGLSENCILEL